MKRTFWFRNALSLTFLGLFLIALVGQALSGMSEHNASLAEHGKPAIGAAEYLGSGHFLQATFENWESEFLQMALFVILTVYLKQEGSSESAPLEDDGERDDEMRAQPDSPAAVRRGGWVATLYSYSLSIALSAAFVASFLLHWYGSWKDYNLEQRLAGQATVPFAAYLGHARFWFESFQNWQSEFLSIVAIVWLSIYLRQKGSPQSKPVNAPHMQTGE